MAPTHTMKPPPGKAIELISRARKSARSLTVEMTVDTLVGNQNAWFYAGFQPSEMIERE